MKWFRSHRREPPPATGSGDAAASDEGDAAPETHPSLALGELFAGLHPDRAVHVLDLGPAVGANISWFSTHFACSVEVADLYRSLPAAAGDDPAAALAGALTAEGEAVDVVLAWDLLNYLEREQIRALCEVLAARCNPGAPLFAMLVTAREMPREPRTYLLQGDAGCAGERSGGEGGGERQATSLLYRVDRSASRPAPRYRPAEVDALSPGFEVDRNYLLRHGVQEYILRRAR